MVIQLPRDNQARKAAFAYLVKSGIQHMKLFQAVKIADEEAATRFKAWLADQPKS